MSKITRYIIIFVLLVTLVLFRAFAAELFYDPLLAYFKNDYLYQGIPKMDLLLFFRDVFLRYLVNAIISIAIIWFLFQKKAFVIFSVWFYLVAFILLGFLLFLFLKEGISDYKLVFYIRRFLIQPVFLLLLIPAFYQKSFYRK